MSIDEYVLKMHNIADSLMSVGYLINNDELILYILGGLGNEYESMVVKLTSIESFTLQECQFMLQNQKM